MGSTDLCLPPSSRSLFWRVGTVWSTGALSHPGIASVFDYGEIEEPDPTAYLVMELVEGAPLSAVLARRRRLDPERVLDVVAQAALALDAAHRAGVVHRDVKPSNLVIRPDGVV